MQSNLLQHLISKIKEAYMVREQIFWVLQQDKNQVIELEFNNKKITFNFILLMQKKPNWINVSVNLKENFQIQWSALR